VAAAVVGEDVVEGVVVEELEQAEVVMGRSGELISNMHY
jgi:hypothetical protein